MRFKIGLKKFVTGFVLIGIFFLCSCAGSRQARFLISKVSAPMFDDPVWAGAADPSPIWNPAEGKWFIYYTQRRATLKPQTNVEYCYGSCIGIASSLNGTDWKYEGVCKGDDGLDKPIESNCTWWAPAVIYNDGLYHMFVSWVDGIYTKWEGKRYIKHFTSKDGRNWKYQSTLNLSSDNCIDAGVWQVAGKWYMLYKDEGRGSRSWLAESDDLYEWNVVGQTISDCSHEAPFVWYWKGRYWCIIDAWRKGLRIYTSDNGVDNWVYNNTILLEPGKRPKDNAKGSHPGVIVVGDNAYVFYHVHYLPKHERFDTRRTLLQAAQLEYIDGKVTCKRDKYLPRPLTKPQDHS